MLRKETSRIRKSNLIAISLILMLSLTGCDNSLEETQADETVIEMQGSLENTDDDVEDIIDICLEHYKNATEEYKIADKIDDLKVVRSIVNQLGESGFSAVDSRNQINMTQPQQVIEFCKKVGGKEVGELTIIEVTYFGGFVETDLQTKDGIVNVIRNYYEYKDGSMEYVVTGSFPADDWKYTEEGYLMFSGSWFSEQQYVFTMSGVEEYIAFRVEPLDETYRELNRKYLLPIGYEKNNMFLVDWNEEDFGELNFYDMFDILYAQINGQMVPYVADDNLGVGAVYRIPKASFEDVIKTYFNIDSETLRSKTTFYEEDETYEYRPRGFYEVEYPEYPYSEVIGFTENNDGTITLMVNVVFPDGGDSKVYDHEVVVRPLEDGRVQYVSNRIIPSEDNAEGAWHTPRLMEEEWEEMYGSGK